MSRMLRRLCATVLLAGAGGVVTVGGVAPASAATVEYSAYAHSPGGAVVAAARYTKFDNGIRQYCIKAVSSGHAVSYLRDYQGGITFVLDEWGGDNLWTCTTVQSTAGHTGMELSVEYYKADGTRYAYSDVVVVNG